MKTFWLKRHVDISGVSGTGYVAQGCIFDTGKCALVWLTDKSSVAIYDSIDDLHEIHGHEGATEIEYRD